MSLEVAQRTHGPRSTLPAADATIAETPRARAIAAAASATMPLDAAVKQAVRAQETRRARGFAAATAGLCAFGLVMLFFLPAQERWLRGAALAALVTLGGVALWVVWLAAESARYRRVHFRVFVVAAVSSGLVILYQLGLFSPAPILVPFGLAFFGQSTDRRFAIGAGIVMTAAYTALAALVATGALPDLGMVRGVFLSQTARVHALLLLPAVFLVSLAQARLGRRATVEAIQRANEATRLALQREGQIEEAHRNLDLVLRAAAGQGKHTGSRAGSYELAEVIGRGAMGEVYAAAHVETGEPAAVKLVKASVLEEPAMVARFLREGQVAVGLRAPNVVRVLEIGETADGAPFIAMERLHGTDLSARLRQTPQLDLGEVARMVEQVAAGLSAAHAASVVHRDLKPQNIFLAELPGAKAAWKILDFGVSKILGSTGTLTQQQIVGTPGYMSPEQAQGLEVGPAADLFSLGAVAYRALTGRPAFSGSDLPQILFDVVYGSPARPSDLCPALPSDVELVLALSLAKKAEDRLQTAEEMASAFRAAARSELAPALRDRARALLSHQPWGRPLGGSPLDDSSSA
jgi:serine/threonine-protein kinase